MRRGKLHRITRIHHLCNGVIIEICSGLTEIWFPQKRWRRFYMNIRTIFGLPYCRVNSFNDHTQYSTQNRPIRVFFALLRNCIQSFITLTNKLFRYFIYHIHIYFLSVSVSLWTGWNDFGETESQQQKQETVIWSLNNAAAIHRKLPVLIGSFKIERYDVVNDIISKWLIGGRDR